MATLVPDDLVAPREGDVQRSVLDPSPFESEVGSPTPLAQGLAVTARALREVPR